MSERMPRRTGENRRTYYSHPLDEAIGDYKDAQIPGIRQAREKLARAVVEAFNKGDKVKAITALLEAWELRQMADQFSLRTGLENLEEKFSQSDAKMNEPQKP